MNRGRIFGDGYYVGVSHDGHMASVCVCVCVRVCEVALV